MPAASLPRGALRTVAAISITQVVGWVTTFNFPAILGRSMAQELAMPLSSVFVASTAWLVAFGLFSPLLAPWFIRIGAGPILVTGSVLTALNLAALASCTSEPVYYLLCCGLGLCGSMTLSTAAHALLGEIMGTGAKRWITAVMIVSGLSTTVGYPATEWLHQTVGWRMTILAFAGVHLLVCLPLYVLAAASAPKTPVKRAEEQAPAAMPVLDPYEKRIFLLLCLALSLNGFVAWGLFVVMIELFRAVGLSPVQALVLASSFGILQAGARLVEFFVAPRASALVTGMIGSVAVPVSILVLMVGQGSQWSAWGFVMIYGFASGGLSVARATLPLELFRPETYGYHTSRMSLPMYLSFAAAGPVFMALIERYGAQVSLSMGLVVSLLSFCAMMLLRSSTRPRERLA